MSLTVTQRPYQTINGESSKWNAVAHPVLYKMQRKDFTFASITNSGGFVRLVLDSSFGDVSASFDVDDYIYFQTDAGVYAVFGTVTASSYSAPNTLVTLDTTYISSSTGFVNSDALRPSYRVEVSVYNSAGTLLNQSPETYSPFRTGSLSIDVSGILRNFMLPDNDVSLTVNSAEDTNVFIGFYITYTEVWSSSAESAVSDSANVFYAILGAMQIPSTYGSNIYEYLILSNMKIFDVTIPAASVLTANATPVNVSETPAAGYVIVPFMFLVTMDYNSAAYATNTSFRFEINGVPVSGTNTTVLPGVADRFTTILPIAYDGTTDLRAHPIKFEVQTGNPTAGNSPIRVQTIYAIRAAF